MALTNAFNEAVSSGNVRRVRIMMKNSMLNDPTFSKFIEMNNAARNLAGLYDVHDGRELNCDKGEWNDSYMDKLMVQVVDNFSHERVDHLKDVVRQLRPVATGSRTVQSSGRSFSERGSTSGQTNTHRTDYQKQKYRDQRNGSYRGAKIAGGAIIGAVVGGAISAAASVSVIGGVAIGAVAGAVVVTVVTNGE